MLEQPLGPLSAIEQDALVQSKQLARPVPPAVPSWIVQLAGCREHLRHCIIRIHDAEGTRFFKFLFAVLWPTTFISFLELAEEADDDVLAAVGLHGGGGVFWENAFWFSPACLCFTNGEGEAWHDDTEVHVLEDVIFFGGTRLCSDAEWVRWEVFAARFPIRRQRHGHEARAAVAARPAGAVVAEHPWLQDILGHAWEGVVVRHGHRPAAIDGDDSGGELGDDDFERDDVWAVLADARAALVDTEDVVEHFAWNLRGGAWTRDHVGLDYDSFRSFATTGEGKAFLGDHGFAQSATFSVRRYGEHACAVFCRYWVARMSGFMALSLERAAGRGDAFSEATFARLVEPADFVALAETAHGHVLARVRALRALRPVWLQTQCTHRFTVVIISGSQHSTSILIVKKGPRFVDNFCDNFADNFFPCPSACPVHRIEVSKIVCEIVFKIVAIREGSC